MTHQISIQYATDKALAPKPALLRQWARCALNDTQAEKEITVRIVGVDEMTSLNETYRRKSGPTNVLSFPFEAMPPMDEGILGDIVICAEVVNGEAYEQRKSRDEHWAHMIVHGVLHLLGYDHEVDDEAEVMEALEVKILAELGYANPYENGESIRQYE